MSEEKLSKTEIDQLVEVTNIGAGNAGTALSHMLGKRINMAVPSCFKGTVEEVQRELGEDSNTVLAVFLKVYGDIDGALVMIFPPQGALDFVRILTKHKREKLEELSDYDKSALLEIGNILLGASITALSKFLDLSLQHSIPDVEVDMLGAIMDSVLIEMGRESEEILAFRVSFKTADEGSGGDLYYLFDPHSSEKILEITKRKMGENNAQGKND